MIPWALAGGRDPERSCALTARDLASAGERVITKPSSTAPGQVPATDPAVERRRFAAAAGLSQPMEYIRQSEGPQHLTLLLNGRAKTNAADRRGRRVHPRRSVRPGIHRPGACGDL